MTRVMIVDDELEMSRLLKMLLELEGFTVDTSATGTLALSKASEQAPDVFMVDYHLHDMSGEELIRRIRAHETLSKTPIMVASGRDVEPEVKRAGATDFMLKPFEPDALIEALRRLTTPAVVVTTAAETAVVETAAAEPSATSTTPADPAAGATDSTTAVQQAEVEKPTALTDKNDGIPAAGAGE